MENKMAEKRTLKQQSLLKFVLSKKQKVDEASDAENDTDKSGDPSDSDYDASSDGPRQSDDEDDIMERSTDSESANENEPSIEDTLSHSSGTADDIGDTSIDSEIQNEILLSKMSIYKLKNSRINGLNDIPKNNITSLREKIVESLTENEHVKHISLRHDESPPFFLTLFFYLSEQEKDLTTTQIAEHRQAKEKEPFKGKRDGGSIFVHYRFNGNSPEVFFLCSNTAFHAVWHLSDPSFRTQVAKHFMDGEHIKELETINIAGPDILTKITYREPTNIATLTSVYLEKAVSRISGMVKQTSSLYNIIKERKQNFNLEIGMNFVKIGKCLSYIKWAQVLDLFSKELAYEINPTTNRICEALDYAQRIDPQLCKELDNTLSAIAIDAMTEKNLTGDLHLSHRFPKDWILATSVTLSIAFKENTSPIEIKTWADTPTLENVVKEIHDYIGSQHVKGYLKEKGVMLAYRRQGKQEIHPVQNFVHGHVDGEDGTYYKLGQKWYLLSSTYSQIVDRNFKYFADSNLLRDKEGKISTLLVYPWNTNSKHSFTLEDVENYFKLPTGKGKKLLTILMKQMSIVDENGQCDLTESSCLLSATSELYQSLKSKEEKKRKSKTQKKSDPKQGKLDSVIKPKPKPSNTSPPVNDQSLGSDNELSNDGVNPNPDVESNPDETHKTTLDSVCGELLALVRKQNIPFQVKYRSILRKDRFICRKSQKDEERFIIANPILTEYVLNEIQTSIQELKHIDETKITQFLRFMSKQSEGEYNELYLHYEENPDLVVIPGDRITPNGVELFDILIHDKSLKTGPKTYLFHCKEKFGNSTRDSCAQIRNSSELLWHDFRKGRKTHVEKFFDLAVNFEKKDAYRILLKEKMEVLGKEKFLEMFEDNTQIVFVYAFLQGDTSDLVSLKFKPVEASDLKDFGGAKVLNCLVKKKFLIDGYLADSFISKTQIDFIKQCSLTPGLKSLTRDQQKKLYNKLCELGKCKLSTIAKLELLTLDNCFARYQIGGKRRFELKFVKIKSP